VLFLKHTFIVLIVLWAGGVLLAGEVDRWCIKGRVSAVQAERINSGPWKKCPAYLDQTCLAQENDRVLARECSEISKTLFLGRFQIDEIIRGK
jgi:hypothetical protein